MSDPIITWKDGRVYWRGYNKDPDECALLLAQFRRTAAMRTDYFRNSARELADALEAAMREVGFLQSEEKAA